MNDEQPVPKAIPVSGWKIRFDAPPRGRDARAAGRGDILALFRAWDGVNRDESDQRESVRYRPAETRAWVGWWRRGHFLVSRAEIVNLSEGGARVRLAQQPPSAVPVWVCLGNPNPTDYIQARVLETFPQPEPPPGDHPQSDPDPADPDRPAAFLPFVSRIAFHAPCPGNFFVAAGRSVEGSRED